MLEARLRTVADAWEDTVQRFPENSFLAFEDRSYTYAAMEQAALRVAEWGQVSKQASKKKKEKEKGKEK